MLYVRVALRAALALATSKLLWNIVWAPAESGGFLFCASALLFFLWFSLRTFISFAMVLLVVSVFVAPSEHLDTMISLITSITGLTQGQMLGWLYQFGKWWTKNSMLVVLAAVLGILFSGVWYEVYGPARNRRRPAPTQQRPGKKPYSPSRVTLEPGNNSITVRWNKARGHIDGYVVAIGTANDPNLLQPMLTVDPQSREAALTSDHVIRNGVTYWVGVYAVRGDSYSKLKGPYPVIPTLPGCEMEDNRALPQQHLVYPSPEAIAAALAAMPAAPVQATVVKIPMQPAETQSLQTEAPRDVNATCGCGSAIQFTADKLFICSNPSCRRECVVNSRDLLVYVSLLRYGTCKCCRPKGILIKPPQQEQLICEKSGKSHAIYPNGEVMMAEGLPFGLCSCCSPWRPLVSSGQYIVCAQSGDMYELREGTYVKVQLDVITDAQTIADMLNRGAVTIGPNGAILADQRNPRRR